MPPDTELETLMVRYQQAREQQMERMPEAAVFDRASGVDINEIDLRMKRSFASDSQ